jgi:nucleoside-diphosphate-sugar epimerase
MNIFVTGATGVLGRATVPLLIAAGHRVGGLARSPENDAVLRRLGATPMRADLFDTDALREAMTGHDAVFHLATRIPPTSKAGRRSAWRENDRIRREGTRNLIEAARATGVGTFIYPSIAFGYPDSGDRWIDAETTPVASHVLLQSTLDAEAAVARFAGEDRRGIVLRLGTLYGPESPAAAELLRYARRGIAAFPGPRDAYLPTIRVRDAAAALVAALAQAPSGVYDVVDDDPLTRGELFTAMARSVGRPRLRRLPGVLVRLLAGVAADLLSRSQRVSNRRFRAITDWSPSVPNARVGWARMADSERKGEASGSPARAGASRPAPR